MGKKHLKNYMDDLLSIGKWYFTKEKAMTDLELSNGAFNQQIYRLYKKQAVIFLGKGFYFIIPCQYRGDIAIPAHWYIDPYFTHLKEKYYISLLSAASYYGVVQQDRSHLHIMVKNKRTNLNVPHHVSIVFHKQRNIDHAKTVMKKTQVGYVNFATIEQTIVDLLKYYEDSGRIDMVAGVIKKLVKKDIEVESLISLLEHSQPSVIKRLGYILDEIKETNLSDAVYEFYKKSKKSKADLKLKTENQSRNGKYNRKWNIVVNEPLRIEQN